MSSRPPRLRGPFAARFLTYGPVPFIRNVRVRFGCAVDPDIQHCPWYVSEATRELQIAVQNPSHAHAALAQELFHQDANAAPARLPRAFAPDEEVWLFGAELPVDELPADTRERWAIPEDLFCSSVILDAKTGLLKFALPPADTVLERQKQRIRVAQRNGGVPVTAILVQANPSLYYPGDDNQPATVVFSPDPTTPIDLLRRMADLALNARGQAQTDPNLATLGKYLANDTTSPFRRRQFAKRLSEGATVFIADLQIYRAWLPDGVIRERQALRCVAEPGSLGGAIEMTAESRVGTA